MIKGRLKQFQTALVIGEGLFQCVQQLSVNSAETAVAHDQNMVACFGILRSSTLVVCYSKINI